MSDVGISLLKGVRQALSYAKGTKHKAKVCKVMIPTEVDVQTIMNCHKEKIVSDEKKT